MNATSRKVILRNNTAAVIEGLARIGPARDLNMLQGHRVEHGHLELWLTTGRWSYGEGDHPLDIVKAVTPKGEVVAFGQEVSP